MDNKVKVAIIGASGYTGAELLRLLVNHPNVEIYSPPYLYVAGSNTLATRPLITQAPSTAAYDANINVETSSASRSLNRIFRMEN